MTYKKLYEDALFKLEHNKITLGEFEKMIKPLDREVEQEPILDKIRAEIEHIGGDDEKAFCKNLNESYKQGLKDVLKVIDKYKTESEESDEI